MTAADLEALARAAGVGAMPCSLGGYISHAELRPVLARFAALVAERNAALVQAMTARKRLTYSALNGADVLPCELAAAIRADVYAPAAIQG